MAEQNSPDRGDRSSSGQADTEPRAEERIDDTRGVWVRWRLRAAIAAAAIIVSVSAAFGAEAMFTRGRVATNVNFSGRDVSRASPVEVTRVAGELERELAARKLRVRIEGADFELEPKAIGFRLDLPHSLERVLAEGRSGGLVARFSSFVARVFGSASVVPIAQIDRALLGQKLEQWQNEALADRPSQGGILVKGRAVEAVYPKGGRGVPADEAERLLLAALVARDSGDLRLPVAVLPSPLERSAIDEAATRARALLASSVELALDEPPRKLVVSPEALGLALRTRRDQRRLVLELDPAALRAALEAERAGIEAEAVDAKFEVDAQDHLSITPSSPGLRIDFEKLPEVLLSAAESHAGKLPVRFDPLPKLTAEEAQKLGIKGLVSTFTTRHACCERRVENIHRIADLLNGLVVRPGETVSLNTVVGPRTQKNGFVPAPTIEEGEFVDTPGGGISQFATTIFNALFHGGYDIIERQPHTYWFPRYPEGHEATLSWPKPDLIFRNDTEAGLLIRTVYTDKTITVRLYGDNGGRRVRAQVSARSNITDPPLTLVANPGMEPNREKVKASGAVGWSIYVSRLLTFADGTTREEKRKVTYKPKPREVEVHPCRIPKGEKGYTGERCPEPKDAEIAAPEDAEE